MEPIAPPNAAKNTIPETVQKPDNEKWNSQRTNSAYFGFVLAALGAIAALKNQKKVGISGMMAGWQLINSARTSKNGQFNLLKTMASIGISTGLGFGFQLLPTGTGLIKLFAEKTYATLAAAIGEGIKPLDKNDPEGKGKKILKASVFALAGSCISDGAKAVADLGTIPLVQNLDPVSATLIPEAARGFCAGAVTTAGLKVLDAGVKKLEEKKDSSDETDNQSATEIALDILFEGTAGAVINTVAAVPDAKAKIEKIEQKNAEEKKAKEIKDLQDQLEKSNAEKKALEEKAKKAEQALKAQQEAFAEEKAQQEAKQEEIKRQKEIQTKLKLEIQQREQERARIKQDIDRKIQEFETHQNQQIQDLNQQRLRKNQEFSQQQAQLEQDIQRRQALINEARKTIQALMANGYKDAAEWRRGNIEGAARDLVDGRKIHFKKKGSDWEGQRKAPAIPDRTNELQELAKQKAAFETEIRNRETQVREITSQKIQEVKQKLPIPDPVTAPVDPSVKPETTATLIPDKTAATPATPVVSATASNTVTNSPLVETLPQAPTKLPVAAVEVPPAPPTTAKPAGQPAIETPSQVSLLSPPFLDPRLLEERPFVITVSKKTKAYSKLLLRGNKKLRAYETMEGPSNILHALFGKPDERGVFIADVKKIRLELAEKVPAKKERFLDENAFLTIEDLIEAARCLEINLIIHAPSKDWDLKNEPLQSHDRRILTSTTVNAHVMNEPVHILHDGIKYFLASEVDEGHNYVDENESNV